VQPGDEVSVTAVGQVYDDVRGRPNRYFGPQGRDEPGQNLGDVLTTANHAALIGRVGEGTPFPLGKDGTYTAVSAGVVWLGVNDGLFTDNDGSYQVHVTVRRA